MFERFTRRLDAVKVLIGVVSFLRSALVLPLRPAGDAGDEVLRSRGEKLEFRPLERAERRREAGIGEPLAQQSDRGLVLGTGVARRCSLQAGIAEEAMNDRAHRLADFEIVEKTGIALGRRTPPHAPRGRVAVPKVAWERDVVTLLGSSVTECRPRSPTE